MLGYDEEQRMWQAEDHPKAPKGQTNGGQFVAKGGGAGSASKRVAPAKRTPPKKAAPAKHLSAHEKHLAHPAHLKTHPGVAAASGASHGHALVPGGRNDPGRVRELQQLLAGLH